MVPPLHPFVPQQLEVYWKKRVQRVLWAHDQWLAVGLQPSEIPQRELQEVFGALKHQLALLECHLWGIGLRDASLREPTLGHCEPPILHIPETDSPLYDYEWNPLHRHGGLYTEDIHQCNHT